MADPNWRGGHYYGHKPPRQGLSAWRAWSATSPTCPTRPCSEKFGRRLQDIHDYSFTFSADFEVESYLRHQGLAFTDRFDANTYLYITRAMDYFDLTRRKHEPGRSAFRDVTGALPRAWRFSSDWLHPPYQLKQIVSALRATHKHVSYYEVESPLRPRLVPAGALEDGGHHRAPSWQRRAHLQPGLSGATCSASTTS